MRFAVWGKKNAEKNAQCMEQYRERIASAANDAGISALRYEGLLFVESACDKNAKSKAGAAGLAQIMPKVARQMDMFVPVTKTVTTKDRRGRKVVRKVKTEVDLRFDPDVAIRSGAQILARAKRYWGEEEWAFVEYHMGIGNLRNLVVSYLDEVYPGWRKDYPANFDQVKDPNGSVPQAVRKYGLTYFDIYFRSTPKHTPLTYSMLRRLADFSGTYVFAGRAAEYGLGLMRGDLVAFRNMIAKEQTPNGSVANMRMRKWYSEKDAIYHNLDDIVSATAKGELVVVPNNPRYGFVLRTTGPNRIGECDPGNESAYHVTSKATVGLILFTAARLQELGAQTVEVTGLVRTNWMYDTKKCLPNTQPRTHVACVAFDIGQMIEGQVMSDKTRDALNFILRDMELGGLIGYIKEGTADHIVIAPEAQEFFEQIYNQVMLGGHPLVVG
jgi:hypothetical protein